MSLLKKKSRFDDILASYEFTADNSNSLRLDGRYSPAYGQTPIISIGYNITKLWKLMNCNNTINFVNKNIEQDIYQLVTSFEWKKKLKTGNNNFFYLQFRQTADLKDVHILKQEIRLIRDLHCITGELTMLKSARKDYSIYAVFKIKGFDKQGIGLKYLYPSNTLKIKR